MPVRSGDLVHTVDTTSSIPDAEPLSYGQKLQYLLCVTQVEEDTLPSGSLRLHTTYRRIDGPFCQATECRRTTPKAALEL